jgi:hypothetical protein
MRSDQRKPDRAMRNPVSSAIISIPALAPMGRRS